MEQKKQPSSRQPVKAPQPDKIAGSDYLMMTGMANFISENPEKTPLNQKKAFGYIFKLAEELLHQDRNLKPEVLEKAYREMGKFYQFNYSQNQTFSKFTKYLEKSHRFMDELDHTFPNRIDLFEAITGVRLAESERSNFLIRKGPFAFEIKATPEIISLVEKGGKKGSYIEEIKNKIFPGSAVDGLSHFIVDPNNERVRANFIMYPKKDPQKSLTARLDYFFADLKRGGKLKSEGLPVAFSENSQETIKIHENQHAIFHLLEFSQREDNSRDIEKELNLVLQTSQPDQIKEIEFHLFCDYLVKTSFFSHAANELLATLKEQNFVSRYPIVTNTRSYDFAEPLHPANLVSENDLIRDILENRNSSKTNVNANRYYQIYLNFSNQASNEIKDVALAIAKFVAKYPTSQSSLANILMFENFENWKMVISELEQEIIRRKP
jgi:hypothetical protein